MKLLLLHGPAISISRKKLIEIKNKFDINNAVIFEKNSDPKVILDSLSSQSLFPDEQIMILENPPEDFTPSTLYSGDLTLVFWFDHEVSGKKPILDWVKKLKGAVLFFSEGREVSVFPFLDFLATKDKKAFLELQKLKNAGFDIQYLLTMAFYLLRNLVSTPKKAPEFVRNKLQRQRKNFTQDQIIGLYKDILEIDFKIKSGLLDTKQAEFLLINRFL